jgi:GT2 family glycosyltransferase
MHGGPPEDAEPLGNRVDLSVIILSWNTETLTRNCLQSIFQQKHSHRIQVIVADNASQDNTRAMVRSEFPQALLVEHERNLGFCAGNNRAIPHATGRWILFLNSDTIVTQGAFDTMVDFADADPTIGILGPKLLNQDGTLQYSCRRFPNLGAGFFRNTPLGRLFPNNRYTQNYLMSDWDHAEPRDVDWLSGAALMLRRETFEQTGAFDENYYMFCEDVDLCYRAHQSGWRVVYCPYAVIYHLIGQSTILVPARSTWLFHRAMYRFYKLHYAKSTPLLIRPLILPGLAARAAGQIIRYRWRRIKTLMAERKEAAKP